MYTLAIRLYVFLHIFLYCNYAYSDNRIRVVVIDTGVDVSHHPKIADVLCPKGEHLDAITNTTQVPKDTEGHGTHIAGIIRALAGDKGYCLSICKFYVQDATGNESIARTTACFKLAKKLNAKYINYSGGGPSGSKTEKAAIEALTNTTVYVAAGNDNSDLDSSTYGYYPASYNLSNEIIVGAIDLNHNKVATSNYGSIVSKTYPGESMYSTLPGGRYHYEFGYMTGTSQATAIATGTALRTYFTLEYVDNYWKFLRDFWIK